MSSGATGVPTVFRRVCIVPSVILCELCRSLSVALSVFILPLYCLRLISSVFDYSFVIFNMFLWTISCFIYLHWTTFQCLTQYLHSSTSDVCYLAQLKFTISLRKWFLLLVSLDYICYFVYNITVDHILSPHNALISMGYDSRNVCSVGQMCTVSTTIKEISINTAKNSI